MPLLPKSVRRFAALGLLVLALAAAWWLLLAPGIASRLDVRERILLGRLQAAAAEHARLAKAPAAPTVQASPVLLAGGSEAIAQAGLQSNVTALAAQFGARPQTTRMLSVVERDGLRLAGVHIEITAPIETVQRVLYAIESASPVLMIEHLTLEPVTAMARAGGIDDGSLRATLHVYGVLPSRKESEPRAP